MSDYNTALPRSGDMAARIRSFDWAATSLGPMAHWPVQLKCAVDLALPSHAEIVMFCGPEFVAIYNDAYAPTIGSKHPAALGRPAREYWTELWDDLEPLLRRVLETGETVFARDRPFYIERPVPETVYFDISYSPVCDDEGRVLAVFCIVKETTDRVGFEAALRQSEERLRSMIEQTTVGVTQTDSQGRLSFVNQAFCDMTGYGEEELLGQSLIDITHPDDVAESNAHILRMAATGESYVIEKRYIRKNGKPIWVASHVSALKDGSGNVSEAVAVVVDITARRHALEIERRLASIISSSEDAILGIDLDMVVTDWNDGAEHLYGYPAEAIVGRNVTALIPEDRIDEETRIIERIKAGERIEPHETVRRHRSGRLVDVSLSVSPIYDTYGRIVGASKIARDISTRKETERIQTVLVGELNHRVKNVLATVLAIARQTFGQATEIEVASATFEARLMSLARAHDLLTRGSWEKASLIAVVLEALSPFPKDSMTIDGPDLDVAPRAVVAIALALHELATNAAKYGAFSVPTGRVSVSWTIKDGSDPRFLLSWREHGGPPVSPPTRKGFGSRLIAGLLAGELNGEVEMIYDPAGFRCEIEASLKADWTAGGDISIGN